MEWIYLGGEPWPLDLLVDPAIKMFEILPVNKVPSRPRGSKRNRRKLLLSLKKILRTGMVIVQGTAIGLGLNYLWHYFLAVYLGWGDSAPDWYFQVQGMIFMVFFLLGLIGWALCYPRLDGYLARKKI